MWGLDGLAYIWNSLMGKLLTISRKWQTLGGAVPFYPPAPKVCEALHVKASEYRKSKT